MTIEPFERNFPKIHAEAYVHAGAYLLGDVEVGPFSSIWPSAVLRGDHGPIRVGARSSIQDGAVAHATERLSQVIVGDDVTVGHRAILHGCRIGNFCLVGMGSTLLDNVELGDFCLVGANSLLTAGKKFPPNSFILGSPGVRVREITAKEREWIEYSSKAYQNLARRYQGKEL